MLASLLETYGYQSQNLKKDAAAAFFDHIHFTYALNSDLFISRDEKLIKKVGRPKAVHIDEFIRKIKKGTQFSKNADGIITSHTNVSF